MKVLHIPCFYPAESVPVLEANINSLMDYKRVGLVATAQHLHQLESIKNILESHGKKAYLGGQVLGCDISKTPPKADCIIYIGSGRFHPTKIALETRKPVLILNPISKTFEKLSAEEVSSWEQKRKARLKRAAGANTFGVLVSTKSGQFHIEEAWKLKEKLESAGKKAYVFAGNELSPANVLPFKVDCWVNTACPRIADDEYEKPVVNEVELSEIF